MPEGLGTTLLPLLVFLAGYGSTIASEPLPVEFQSRSTQQSAGAEQVDSERSIMTAFDEHFEYFKSEMYRRLTKDSDGNADTYVLYDVQMHMQNAVIYADEQGDREKLSKLLELCLIPFESQHITDGKWLNNRYGLVGVEVDLCIAQYFSLLTRVLSACGRHGATTRFSDEKIRIVTGHIDNWLEQPVGRSRVDDRHMFFVQSALQFYDYMRNAGMTIANIDAWKQYVR
ncbi:MAG: hypothetical protein QGI83_15835, partial [Candidatus Latescibacteria bacterium]|nr:hypothetical protein [Candidatus Latescibacterota bacterium]